MPLYEYYCEKCDEVFEALRSVSASEEAGDVARSAGATRTESCRRRSPRCPAGTGMRSGFLITTSPVRADAPAKTIARGETEGLRQA